MANKKKIEMDVRNATEYDLYGNKNARKAALEQALKTREFEISLYWKRTAYFWAFIVSIYIAYFSVFTMKDGCNSLVFIRPAALISLSYLGFFFSLAWFMVNKGSKFWQENWETHVSMLEDDVIGPLYKTHLNPSYSSLISPTKAYDFSVSKVNMLASFLVGLFAIGFFIWNVHHFLFDLICLFYCKDTVDLPSFIRTIIASLVIILVTIITFFKLCSGNKETEKQDEKFFIRRPRSF